MRLPSGAPYWCRAGSAGAGDRRGMAGGRRRQGWGDVVQGHAADPARGDAHWSGSRLIRPRRSMPSPAMARRDLLCYRAETPQTLVQRQHQQWQPWLDWAALTYDAPLRVGTGVAYVKQHHDSIAALRRAVAALDVDALAGLGIAVPALGSLVLGLALGGRRVGCGKRLYALARWTSCSRRSNGVKTTRRRIGAPACWRTSCWRRGIST